MEEGLNWSHFLESVAFLNGVLWSDLDSIEFGAILGFLSTLVVVADVLEEAVTNSIVDIFSMDTVGNDPWDVLVWWRKSLSLESDSMLVFDGIWSFVASDDVGNVLNLGLGSASLSDTFVVLGCSIFLLNAVDEFLGHIWAFDKVDTAGFQQVVLALNFSMLAREIPGVTVLFLMSITVWMHVDLSHGEETISLEGLVEGGSDHSFAAWALTFIVEVDLDSVIGSRDHTQEGENSEGFHIELS